jgi:hypothetical protein
MNTTPDVRIPFLLNFVIPVDQKMYDEALAACVAVGDTYDPETQTSAHTIYAGTSHTYNSTYTTGIIILPSTDPDDASSEPTDG